MSKYAKQAKYAGLFVLGAVIGWAGYQSARTYLQRRREKAIPDIGEDAYTTGDLRGWTAPKRVEE